jgi:hypothetical protein
MTNPTTITPAVTNPTGTGESTQFTPAQRKIIYLATFTIGVVTIVTAPVVVAVSAPAWIPALIGGLGSAASIVSATFGWKYLGR